MSSTDFYNKFRAPSAADVNTRRTKESTQKDSREQSRSAASPDALEGKNSPSLLSAAAKFRGQEASELDLPLQMDSRKESKVLESLLKNYEEQVHLQQSSQASDSIDEQKVASSSKYKRDKEKPNDA